MRITSFRVLPVARIVAIIYGVLGIFYVPASLLSGANQMTLPLGILAPLVYLSFNLHLRVPTHFLTGVLSAMAACACYALSGWLTGTAAVLAFNFVAAHIGGVDASLLTNNIPTAPTGPV
jgi:hypothetical protein